MYTSCDDIQLTASGLDRSTTIWVKVPRAQCGRITALTNVCVHHDDDDGIVVGQSAVRCFQLEQWSSWIQSRYSTHALTGPILYSFRGESEYVST